MIAREVIQVVERLLAEGTLTQQEIAERTGVGRGTVAAVANGRRRSGEPEEEAEAGPAVRCAGCGGMVHFPCRLCKMRKRAARSKKRATSDDRHSPEFRLELNEHQRARYAEVRAQKPEEDRRREPPEETAGPWAASTAARQEDQVPDVLGRAPDLFAPLEEDEP